MNTDLHHTYILFFLDQVEHASFHILSSSGANPVSRYTHSIRNADGTYAIVIEEGNCITLSLCNIRSLLSNLRGLLID